MCLSKKQSATMNYFQIRARYSGVTITIQKRNLIMKKKWHRERILHLLQKKLNSNYKDYRDYVEKDMNDIQQSYAKIKESLQNIALNDIKKICLKIKKDESKKRPLIQWKENLPKVYYYQNYKNQIHKDIENISQSYARLKQFPQAIIIDDPEIFIYQYQHRGEHRNFSQHNIIYIPVTTDLYLKLRLKLLGLEIGMSILSNEKTGTKMLISYNLGVTSLIIRDMIAKILNLNKQSVRWEQCSNYLFVKDSRQISLKYQYQLRNITHLQRIRDGYLYQFKFESPVTCQIFKNCLTKKGIISHFSNSNNEILVAQTEFQTQDFNEITQQVDIRLLIRLIKQLINLLDIVISRVKYKFMQLRRNNNKGYQ